MKSKWRSLPTCVLLGVIVSLLFKIGNDSSSPYLLRFLTKEIQISGWNKSGLNAYRQFEKSLLPENILESDANIYQNYMEFTYEFEVQCMSDGSVTFILSERYRGNQTRGGSSFLAIQEPNRICRMVDHFDGRYTGICDPIPLAACLKITVLLQSVRYYVYRSAVNLLNRVILEEKICVHVNATDSDLYKYRKNRIITWSPESLEKTTMTHYYGIPIGPQMNFSMICRRLEEKYDHMTMVGASHSRYQFDYFLEHCYPYSAERNRENIVRKHSSYKIGKIDYKEIKICKNYPKNIKQQLTEFKYKNRSLIILQAGSHDINRWPLNESIHELREFMNSVRTLCESVNGDVVVIGTPPFPDHEHNLEARNWRNNYSLAALNYVIETEVMDLMVRFTIVY